MGICPKELIDFVIRPTLEHLGAWSLNAEQLLLGTAAQESGLGYHLGNQGAGCGIYCISADTHQQVWDQYLAFHPDFASAVRGLASQKEFLSHPHAELSTNLAYATAVAWAIYCWRGAELGTSFNLLDLGRIWHSCFSSPEQSAADDFASNYRHYVGTESSETLCTVQDAMAISEHSSGEIGGHYAA